MWHCVMGLCLQRELQPQPASDSRRRHATLLGPARGSTTAAGENCVAVVPGLQPSRTVVFSGYPSRQDRWRSFLNGYGSRRWSYR
mmetsp:Transcript_50365/g.87566  ORF Transcript_50365/g.87566 Transcript_50365/m.87566 type:complete len:85 (-) Transcript_50365:42-296(-)